MKVAEYLVKRLEELGINHIFGLPGDFNFNILYAIENNPNTRWVGCINELNAGYAADGYARIKGYGAVVTTYGVGELSVINAVAGSMAENIPVMSIVGVPSTKLIETKTRVHHNFQDVNYFAFAEAFKNVTATTAFLNKANAKIEIDRIMKVFVKERKPVYIAIPVDIAEMEIQERDVSCEWFSDEKILKTVSEKIAKKINEAKNPVILGDSLIKRFDAKIEYREFVEKSGIPVTNFLMGTNLIDMDYDKYLGSYYSKFKNPVAEKAVNETDCLIAVGPVYTDLNSYGFNLPYKLDNHVAIYGTYTYVDGIRYDNVKMSDVLDSVTKLVKTREIEIEKPIIGYNKVEASNKELTSEYIYPRLQEFIKENDIVVAETGIIPQGVVQIKFPQNVDIQTQTLWGSIGWATPATLGVALAKPNSRVILITGEGSHQLTAMEIGNMLRFGIKPIVIVLNNKGYTIERVLSNDVDDEFNNIVQMNYSKFARVFEGEVWSTKVTTEEDFDKALKVTQIMNKMCYLEICTSKLDMPVLIKDLIANFKNKNSEKKLLEEDSLIKKEEKVQVIEEKTDEKIEKITENPSENVVFETVVHKSLMED